MRTAEQWFEDYGVSHQNKTNKFIHWICVPLIFFSAYGLLTTIPSTFTQSLFHRKMPYAPEAVRAVKIDSEVNPCFYEAKQHILKEIAPRYIYAIDQCYQLMVLKENKEYDPYGPTFIFLIQALTIERRDTPESHVYLDQLKELQRMVAGIFDSNYPETAEKLSFFLDFC